MSAEAWHQLLASRPDDQTLWTKELQRVEAMRVMIAKRGNPDTDIPLAIGVANNHQLRSIALRHLKRYPDALAAIAESSARLQRTWNLAGCAQPSPPSRCSEIGDHRALSASLEGNIRADQNDADGMTQAFGAAVAFARRTSNYRERLTTGVMTLFRHELFRRSGALLVSEMQAAVDERDNARLLTIADIADAVYGRMFMAISWNLQTGRMRENDPRDFVDNTGIGIGRPMKYGMTDPSEDHATFVTVLVEQELLALDRADTRPDPERIRRGGYGSLEEFMKNVDIVAYVRSEMASGNFEPAVKFLHTTWIMGSLSKADGLVCREKPSKISFSEVARRLRMAPPGTVAPVTVDIFNAYDEANRFVVAHCHARPRR